MRFRIGRFYFGTEPEAPAGALSAPGVHSNRNPEVGQRGLQAVETPTLKDFSVVNTSYVDYVRGLPASDLHARVDEISVDSLGRSEQLETARRILDEFGIVVVRSVVSREACRNAFDAITKFYGPYVATDSDLLEDGKALYQVGSAKLKGYYQLSHYPKAVITRRQGQDEGMIDIFNCDLACPDVLCEIRAIFEDTRVQTLINRQQLKPRNLNVYINRGIMQTRGFHVDSYSENLKAFIYLTDVASISDGPYTFVKRSHRNSSFMKLNRYLCENLIPPTEAPIVDPLAITPILAEMGALVISDQSGIHRGWPQGHDSERMVAVMKYA